VLTAATHCVKVLGVRARSVHTPQSDQLVEVAPGLKCPALLQIEGETDDEVYGFVIEVVPQGGRLVARSVKVHQRVGGPPVTGEAIRSIPVATMVRAAAGGILVEHPDEEGSSIKLLSPIGLMGGVVPEAYLPRLRQNGPTDETLQWVARVYRVALLLSDPPTKAVEALFEVPRSTAGRWVAAARRRGFLGRSEGAGRAGG